MIKMKIGQQDSYNGNGELQIHLMRYCIYFTSLPTKSPSWPKGHFKGTYKFSNHSTLFKIWLLYRMYIFQCVGTLFCEEFQRVPLIFPKKILHQYTERYDFMQMWKF